MGFTEKLRGKKQEYMKLIHHTTNEINLEILAIANSVYSATIAVILVCLVSCMYTS